MDINNTNIITKLIGCTKAQATKLLEFEEHLLLWNKKVNLISRKTTDSIFIDHIIPSISIAKFIKFKPKTNVLDVGTGGGLPGIPLAILFPEVNFTLIDSIAKKINITKQIALDMGLKNITTINDRVENLNLSKTNSHPKQKKLLFDFILGRAVINMRKFCKWVVPLIDLKKPHNDVHNGIIYLRGLDFEEDLQSLNLDCEVYRINELWDVDYYPNKYLLYIPFYY